MFDEVNNSANIYHEKNESPAEFKRSFLVSTFVSRLNVRFVTGAINVF